MWQEHRQGSQRQRDWNEVDGENCGRFCFWRRQCVVFCLCMKYLGNLSGRCRKIPELNGQPVSSISLTSYGQLPGRGCLSDVVGRLACVAALIHLVHRVEQDLTCNPVDEHRVG